MAARLYQWISRFGGDQQGATAIEYGLIAALIAVACIAVFEALGGNVLSLWETGNAASVLQNATDSI